MSDPTQRAGRREGKEAALVLSVGAIETRGTCGAAGRFPRLLAVGRREHVLVDVGAGRGGGGRRRAAGLLALRKRRKRWTRARKSDASSWGRMGRCTACTRNELAACAAKFPDHKGAPVVITTTTFACVIEGGTRRTFGASYFSGSFSFFFSSSCSCKRKKRFPRRD